MLITIACVVAVFVLPAALSMGLIGFVIGGPWGAVMLIAFYALLRLAWAD